MKYASKQGCLALAAVALVSACHITTNEPAAAPAAPATPAAPPRAVNFSAPQAEPMQTPPATPTTTTTTTTTTAPAKGPTQMRAPGAAPAQ